MIRNIGGNIQAIKFEQFELDDDGIKRVSTVIMADILHSYHETIIIWTIVVDLL